MNKSDIARKVSRMEFLTSAWGQVATLGLGLMGGLLAFRSRRKNTVWQFDPNTCVSCGNCETECVVSPSAVKCVQSYQICGYCRLCFGYFTAEAPELTSAAENQLCPTGAIERVFIEKPYWEYNIDEELCVGCAKCVEPCEVFGNASFYLQIRHDVCVNCNICSIARHCPSDSFKLVSVDKPYLFKHSKDELQQKRVDRGLEPQPKHV